MTEEHDLHRHDDDGFGAAVGHCLHKPTRGDRIDAILARVRYEVLRATQQHGPMRSAHEGYAVLQEEVDELWDHVKADTAYTHDAMREAIQVAAMGVRFVFDLEGDAE
jgi:hypothetical protein